MLSLRRIFLPFVSVLLLVQPAGAAPVSCHIGKPSYCFKYGGALCEKWNRRADAPASCARWTAACIDCHTAIPECLGHQRPASDSAPCTRCASAWRACMARIDARFWPNRSSGHD